MQKREQSNLFLTLNAPPVSLNHPIVNQGLYSSKGRKEKGFEFGLRANGFVT